jgi:hypothetical protein
MYLGSRLFNGVAPFGLIPPGGKEGDLICQFWKTNVTALLLKEEGSEIYRVIGRLNLSTGSLRSLEPVYREWNEPFNDAETMIVQMDIKALSILTR